MERGDSQQSLSNKSNDDLVVNNNYSSLNESNANTPAQMRRPQSQSQSSQSRLDQSQMDRILNPTRRALRSRLRSSIIDLNQMARQLGKDLQPENKSFISNASKGEQSLRRTFDHVANMGTHLDNISFKRAQIAQHVKLIDQITVGLKLEDMV
ncbi:hypothetical protein MP228_009212 [Amoeboaphelidium protococcarum]|nr:hypothetical protein MP228_009212 [Amoeboaphelidium protococcarum]